MSAESWFLEGYLSGQAILSRLPINQFPFLIGRQEGLGFIVPSGKASRYHAEIHLKQDGTLVLKDNGSTNGTFVNRKKLSGEIPIRHGDVLHFADFEVRLIKDLPVDHGVTDTNMTSIGLTALTANLPSGINELQELLDERLVIPAYQAIMDTGTDDVHAYEILGRGKHAKLSSSPGPLFHIAESMDGLACKLSRVFREEGIKLAAIQPTDAKFFINLHPKELTDCKSLAQEMESVRKEHPDLGLVLEIHEQSASNLEQVRLLRQDLESLNIEIAYDDFGAGQARLLELVEAPAHYLKFDIALVRDIDKAPDNKKDMIQMLVLLAKRMGIRTIAEGIERQEEVDSCKSLGFDFIQGYFYGKPMEGKIA
jgi:EAL domain-containing protein (putative c-di-GMP-specific phosphodiesterase class I)